MIKVVKKTHISGKTGWMISLTGFFTLSKIEVRDIMKPTDVGVSNHADA